MILVEAHSFAVRDDGGRIFLAQHFVFRASRQGPAGSRVVPKASKAAARPKLVVLLVRRPDARDYVDKFLGQWTGGLKRLVEEGAWFRGCSYPYRPRKPAGQATPPSQPAHFPPPTHGRHAWWVRQDQKMVTCTADLIPRKRTSVMLAPPERR